MDADTRTHVGLTIRAMRLFRISIHFLVNYAPINLVGADGRRRWGEAHALVPCHAIPARRRILCSAAVNYKSATYIHPNLSQDSALLVYVRVQSTRCNSHRADYGPVGHANILTEAKT